MMKLPEWNLGPHDWVFTPHVKDNEDLTETVLEILTEGEPVTGTQFLEDVLGIFDI